MKKVTCLILLAAIAQLATATPIEISASFGAENVGNPLHYVYGAGIGYTFDSVSVGLDLARTFAYFFDVNDDPPGAFTGHESYDLTSIGIRMIKRFDMVPLFGFSIYGTAGLRTHYHYLDYTDYGSSRRWYKPNGQTQFFYYGGGAGFRFFVFEFIMRMNSLLGVDLMVNIVPAYWPVPDE